MASESTRNSLTTDENIYSSSRVTRSKAQHEEVSAKPRRSILGDRSNTLAQLYTNHNHNHNSHNNSKSNTTIGASNVSNSKLSVILQQQQPVTANTTTTTAKSKLNIIKENARLHFLPSKSTTTTTNKEIPIKKDTETTTAIDEDISTDDASIIEEDKDNRRSSLKRTATDSATNLLEKSNNQDFKKPKVDYCWEDLDEEDLEDPLMVSEYVVDIFKYLNKLELDTLPDKNYLSWQKNLKPRMRSILVDWMVEVHMRFRLLPETLFLAINLMDRFMSKEIVQVDKLQLLATGSLFILAKYEEVYSPSIKNYAYVTDGGFTEDDILGAERFILEILEFNLSYPNPMNFLRRISKADDYDIQSRTIGKYLLEISVIDHKFIGMLPSLCSALAMYVARKMLGRFEWNGNLIHYSGGYTEEDMKECCETLIEYLISPIVHEEFFKKYASKKFFKVSILLRQWAKKIHNEGKNIMDPVL